MMSRCIMHNQSRCCMPGSCQQTSAREILLQGCHLDAAFCASQLQPHSATLCSSHGSTLPVSSCSAKDWIELLKTDSQLKNHNWKALKHRNPFNMSIKIIKFTMLRWCFAKNYCWPNCPPSFGRAPCKLVVLPGHLGCHPCHPCHLAPSLNHHACYMRDCCLYRFHPVSIKSVIHQSMNWHYWALDLGISWNLASLQMRLHQTCHHWRMHPCLPHRARQLCFGWRTCTIRWYNTNKYNQVQSSMKAHLYVKSWDLYIIVRQAGQIMQ